MLDSFKNPPAENRLFPFWVWPASPKPDNIELQLREMQTHGIGGFFVCGPEPPARRDTSAWSLCMRRAQQCSEDLGLEPHFPGLDYEYADDTEDIAPQPAPFSIEHIRAAKTASSAVHAAGKAGLLSRVFGSSSWAITPEEMKRTVDFEAILGASVFCPEVFHYALDGVAKGTPPPPLFYQSTFWSHHASFADYAARLSYVMTQGEHRAQAALLYPAKAFALPPARLEREIVHKLAVDYFNVFCEWLLKNHIDYDIVGEATLLRATVMDQHLRVSGERYGLLILPPLAAIDYDVANKIGEFADDGGHVLAASVLPMSDSGGRKDDEVRAIFAELFGVDPAQLRAGVLTGRLPARPRLTPNGSRWLFQAARPADLVPRIRPVVSKALKPDISIKLGPAECPDILCCRRQTDEADIFFFANTAREPREVRISIRCDRAPHMLSLETGEITALPNCTQQGSRTVLLHRFEPHASLLVAFGDEPALAVAAPAIEGGEEIVLGNEWEFTTAGGQTSTIRTGSWTDQGYEHYSGEGVYRQTVELPPFLRCQRIVLRADDPAEVVEFVVNGASAGVRLWHPFQVDITPLVKPGPNLIELKITNTLVNEVLSETRPSGLLGGARIIIA